MNYFFLKILLLAPILLLCQCAAKVHVSYTNSYCGGARPTPQILEKYKTPKNFSDSEIKLVGKKTYLLTTDSLGFFRHAIKPGKYKVFMTDKKNMNLFTNFDPACKQMLELSYGELEIIKTKKEYELSLYFPCSICQPHDKP